MYTRQKSSPFSAYMAYALQLRNNLPETYESNKALPISALEVFTSVPSNILILSLSLSFLKAI